MQKLYCTLNRHRFSVKTRSPFFFLRAPRNLRNIPHKASFVLHERVRQIYHPHLFLPFYRTGNTFPQNRQTFPRCITAALRSDVEMHRINAIPFILELDVSTFVHRGTASCIFHFSADNIACLRTALNSRRPYARNNLCQLIRRVIISGVIDASKNLL